MPWFEYEGVTLGGTAIAGRIEAADRDRAGAELRRMELDVRELRESTERPKRPVRLSADDLIFFNEQLASLAEAGIALDDGLAQLARDVESPRVRRWIDDLVMDLRRGTPLDQAIAKRESGLPILYSRVIRAGIASGELPATLLNLNQHLRFGGETRRLVWQLAAYPLLVLALALTLTSFFVLGIVPQFREIFADFGANLPGLTLLMLSMSESYPVIMLAFIVIVGGIALGWNALRLSMGGRAFRESVLFMLPAIGQTYRNSLIARFIRAVSTAVATGIPLPQALRLAADATGSVRLITDAERLAGEVERGHSIFTANQSARLIPPLFGFCVQVASSRQDLPVAMSQLARSYESRALHMHSMLRVLLFPVLVIAVGVFLFFMIAALFLPLVTLINSVSG